MVLEVTKRAAEHMAQAGGAFDIPDASKRITSDVMGQLLYGEDLRGTHWESSEYLDLFYTTLKAQAALLTNPFHLWQLWRPEVRLQRRCLTRSNDRMAARARRIRENPPAPHTIAGHLLTAINPDTGKPLDEFRLKSEIATFMGAGFETTSHAITYGLALLAAHPDVQQQVFEELQAEGMTQGGRDFEASDLGHLPLLSAVIKETLRLCAPAPMGAMKYVENQEGADMCGHHVPKGTLVLIPTMPYGLAQHNYGSDASEFKPQRWLTGAAATKSHTGALENPAAPPPAGPQSDPGPAPAAAEHGTVVVTAGSAGSTQPAAGMSLPEPITFLVGTRDCVGQNLAMVELQVVLATLLARFAFKPGPELARELQVAAATGRLPVSAVHTLSGMFLSLQPLSGHMVLNISHRA